MYDVSLSRHKTGNLMTVLHSRDEALSIERKVTKFRHFIFLKLHFVNAFIALSFMVFVLYVAQTEMM